MALVPWALSNSYAILGNKRRKSVVEIFVRKIRKIVSHYTDVEVVRVTKTTSHQVYFRSVLSGLECGLQDHFSENSQFFY